MCAAGGLLDMRVRDDAFRLFVGARDLEGELQREALENVLRTGSAELRQRALRAGAVVLPDDVLVGYLRDGADDVMRNAGLEMLKLRGHRAFATVLGLLEDGDPDVVLQAVLVLDALRDPRAWPRLRVLLRDGDSNVVQAAIMAAGHLGGSGAARDVIPFLSAEPWLQVAAAQALGDLRATSAVQHLAALLSDAFLEPFAAEALARIGDRTAFRMLADHYLAIGSAADHPLYLGLLAGVLADFERPPRHEPLRLEAARQLSGGSAGAAAAWCVLALGPSEADALAIDVLAAHEGYGRCAAFLSARTDLLEGLIRRDPPLRDWAWDILARFPAALSGDAVIRMLRACPPSSVDSLGIYLARSSDPALAAPLVELWISRPAERKPLIAAIRKHRRAIEHALTQMPIADGDRVSLLEASGASPADVARAVAELTGEARWDAVGQLRSRSSIRELPWSQWLSMPDHDDAHRALADAVSRTGCRDLLPLVRGSLAAHPQGEFIAAVGDLRDIESVPILASHLQRATSLLRATLFDSLGRIGGANARAVLRSYCLADSPDAAQASRALAMCAADGDLPILRAAADSPDLAVRLAVVEALARRKTEANRDVLVRLVFDPAAAVAHKAAMSLTQWSNG